MAAVEFEEVDDGVAVVTMNRPELLNAIDGALLDGIDGALDKLATWQYRVAILTGAGRGFCAGADLGEALTLANAAASIVIHQLGTTGTATVAQLRALVAPPQ